MLALLRFLVMGFLVLTVVYASLWLYLRSRRRALLEADWAADTQERRDRDEYLREELAEHDKRRGRMLLLLVYLLPLCLVALIVYRTNFE